MKKTLSLILAILMLTPFFSLVGCKQQSDITILRICNCEDYIDESLLDQFEEESGMRVIYEMFETNEDMYTKIKNSNNSYDVIIPSDYMIERMIAENLLSEIDMSKITMETLPGVGEYIGGISYFVHDEAATRETVDRIFYNTKSLRLFL